MNKILVIDDDDAVRNTMVAILKRGGYEVSTASDGNRGMASFRKDRPALVITDIIMPDKEGIATILDIRRQCPEARIIAMSGGGRLDSADILSYAKKLGANEILYKPFAPDELLKCVRTCLAGP